MLTTHDNRVIGPSPTTAAHENNSVQGMFPVETAAVLSQIDVARLKIALARSLGYAHVLLYMTADEKDAALDQDEFSALKDEGYRIHPGTTPDFTLFERGDPACEVILITWDRRPLPSWATTPSKSARPPQRAKSPARSKAAPVHARSDKSPGKRSAGRAAAKAAATDEALAAHAPVAHTARLKKSAPKPNKMRKGGAP